jgi:uncharacterized protein (TIGR02996 family)
MQPFVDQWADSHDPTVPAIFADNMEEEGDPRHELLRSHGLAAHHGLSPMAKVEADLGLPSGDIDESRKTGRNLLPSGWVHSTQLFGSDGTVYNIHVREHQGQPRVKIVAKLSPSKGSPLVAGKNFWMDEAKSFADRMADHDSTLAGHLHAVLDMAHGEFLNQQHAQSGDQQAHAMRRDGEKAKFARVEAADVHPDYQPTGIAPRIGHALGRIAAEGEDAHGPNHAALAEAILRTGDHSVLPILADALEEHGHPLYHEFDWRHAPRAIEIDRTLAHLIRGKRARNNSGRVDSLFPSWVRGEWTDRKRGRLTKGAALRGVREKIPDASPADMAHSIQRLVSIQDGLFHDVVHGGHRHAQGVLQDHIAEIEKGLSGLPEWRTQQDQQVIKSLLGSDQGSLNPHRYPDTRPQPKQRRAKKNSRVARMGRLQDIPTAQERKAYLDHLNEQSDRELASLTPHQRAESAWANWNWQTKGSPELNNSILRDELDEADDHRAPIVDAHMAHQKGMQARPDHWVGTDPGRRYDRALMDIQTGNDDKFVSHEYAETPNGKRRAGVHFGLFHSPHDGTPMAWVEHSDSHGQIGAHMTADQAMEVARRLPHTNDAEFHSAEAVRKALTEHAATRGRSRLQRKPKKMAASSEEPPTNLANAVMDPPASSSPTPRPFIGNKAGRFRTPEEHASHLEAVAQHLESRGDHRAPIAQAQLDRVRSPSSRWTNLDRFISREKPEAVTHEFKHTNSRIGGKVSFHLYHSPFGGTPMVWARHQDGFGTTAAHLTPMEAMRVARKMPASTPEERASAEAVAAKVAEHAYSRPQKLSKKGRIKKMSREEDDAAFHRAITSDDKDHTPALVYADWLDEQGKTTLASLIRNHSQQNQKSHFTLPFYHQPEGKDWKAHFVPYMHEPGYYINLGTTNKAQESPGQLSWQAGDLTGDYRDMAEALTSEGVGVSFHPKISQAKKLTKAGRPRKMKADVKTGLAQALTRLHSRNEKAFQETLADVLNKTNLKPHRIYQVLHDTPGNVKPSVAASIMKQVEDNHAEYAAAYHGLLTNQSSVLLFKSHPEGNDSIYRMRVPGKPQEIRGLLDKAGFHSRLLVPKANHTEVIMHDPERKMRGKVSGLADKLGVGVEEVTGTGTVLGGRDAESARAKYRDVVRTFESGGKVKMSKNKAKTKFSRKDHEAFTKTIHANPTDFTPKAVYADWLEEKGLHHDQHTLDALRDPGEGHVHLAHFKSTDKVRARKDQSAKIAEDPWNPKLRHLQAQYHEGIAKSNIFRGMDKPFDTPKSEEHDARARFHREFGDHLAEHGKPYFGMSTPAWLENSLSDPDYVPSVAEEHVLNRHVGFPENPPDAQDEWSDDNWGGGQIRFSDGSVLTNYSDGRMGVSDNEDDYEPREYEDEDSNEDEDHE